jgi:peptidyl-prolyl cis-trans isomerase C
VKLLRLLSATALAGALAASASAADVLAVNGAGITPGQWAMAKYRVTADRPSLTGDDAAVARAAADFLVGDVLLAEAARESGVSVSDKDVRKGIVELHARLGGKSAYRDLLKQLGASEDELEALAARRMAAQRFVDTAIAARITVTDEEARAFYETPENQVYHAEQLHLKMIIVNAMPGLSAKEEAEARERIEEAERRIQAGEEFAAVARDVSDDMSKANGGDFGWVGREAIPPRFLGRVWAIEPGEMSEPLRGQFGFALIQVLEKRPRGPFTFDEMRDQVIAQLRKSKVDAAVADLVASRRAAAKIEGLTPETASALAAPASHP